MKKSKRLTIRLPLSTTKEIEGRTNVSDLSLSQEISNIVHRSLDKDDELSLLNAKVSELKSQTEQFRRSIGNALGLLIVAGGHMSEAECKSWMSKNF